jgi:predicted ATP-grasp superfamily ATP-dependent carboligase
VLVKNQIIIAAISSRAYVQAAVDAGFEVIAMDAFCDVDTQKLALQTIIVDTRNGSFQAESFYKAIAKIDCTQVLGMTVGAGFEAVPELLEAPLLKAIPHIFNASSVIKAVKNPSTFFDFLASIHAPYPTTQLSHPGHSIGWLKKHIGGSGGAHIKSALPLDFLEKMPVYYQQKCAGEPYGCLFLADGSNAQVIGIHQQWCAPTATQAYRFGGAVSHAEVSETVVEKIDAYVQTITRHFGLRGINSLDFMLHGNEVNVLEINPRLSASMPLYLAKKGNLFAAHVQAYLGELKQWPTVDKQSRAMQVIYANKTAHVPANMDWPDWVCDIPQPNSEIAAGAPICTVLAQARSAKLAYKKLMQRVALL